MGNFFNHLPNQHNAYGFDIDSKAVAVARYLYPDAHIDKCDIQQYHSEQRFDAIIGNPTKSFINRESKYSIAC